MTRAIVFDLDETLYRERRFIVSGFAQLARHVEGTLGLPQSSAFAILREALRSGRRGQALQLLAVRCGLGADADTIDGWRTIIRTHPPRLTLPRASFAVLTQLRPSWRIGLLTNGHPTTQRNKVGALGLIPLVDAVVYAQETGFAKPAPAAFAAVLERLGVCASESVFVGDDPWTDIHGAQRAGMKTVRIVRGTAAYHSVPCDARADATVPRIADVPAVADALWLQRTRGGACHAA